MLSTSPQDIISEYWRRLDHLQHIDQRDTGNYKKFATTPTHIGKKSILTYAPFNIKHSAYQTTTLLQKIVLFLGVVACMWGEVFYPVHASVLIIIVLTAIYLANLILNFAFAWQTMQRSEEIQIDDTIIDGLSEAHWPSYTILCPLYKEVAIAPQFVDAMQSLDYPANRLQILFLTEENDQKTRETLLNMGLPQNYEVLTVPDGYPRTKPRACNYGLLHATGQFTVIYDAEDKPDARQLKKAVLAFLDSSENVVCVQAKLNFYNAKQNVQTRLFTAEYTHWFDFVLPGLQSANFVLPLGGTSNHFRTEALRSLGAWDPFNVTEDCELGLRLARKHYRTVILDSTTYEEANPKFTNWLRQRSRWIKGYLQTYLVAMRNPLQYLHQNRWREGVSIQILIGGKTFVLFVNPILWAMLAVYIIFRPHVEGLYHALFPTPVLYAAAFCLFVGNFFYLYTQLIACVSRRQYHLTLWIIFTPTYWAMMSIAAYFALYELIFRPHYWQKTEHGLATAKSIHIPSAREQNNDVEQTLPMPAAKQDLSQSAIYARIKTLDMPKLTEFIKSLQNKTRPKKDRWLLATILLSLVLSAASTTYCLQQQYILLWNDSHAHMTIARRIFDSLDPGIANFGGSWLPLQHVLMLPFIYNDTLWQTGLAGSIVSVVAYIITTVYLFFTIKKLTNESAASFLGTLIFAINPNILYLLTTPLGELLMICTSMVSCYYLIAWAKEEKLTQLILAAGATFLATLSRYDGWAMFGAFLGCIAIISIWRKHSPLRVLGNTLIYSLFGGLGILLWLIWSQMIFGDFLYFKNGRYSSHAQQTEVIASGGAEFYHNLYQSYRYFAIVAGQNLGPLLCIAGIIALAIFLSRRNFYPERFATLTVFAIPAFYVLALFLGQATIWAPGAVPPSMIYQYYNIRYGVYAIVPAAIFLGTFMARGHIKKMFIVALLLAQTYLTVTGGVVVVQDGFYGVDCYRTDNVSTYLATHYDKGLILVDTFSNVIDFSTLGIHYSNVVTQGIKPYWEESLQAPETYVDWVVVQPGDLVSERVNITDASFLNQYEQVATDHLTKDIYLFRKKGLPPVQTHSLPPQLASHPYQRCTSYKENA